MRLLVLAFYLLCLVSCSEEKPLQQQDVLQLHKDKQVSVSLSPADAPVEEILNWTIELSDGWQIKQAEVTGLSMSMGTIPLLFKAVAEKPALYSTEMVLGACSQPRMKWQLQLKLHHATEGEKVLLLPFYSSWPD
ncbi:hypothetical protein [Rheinheimera sp. MM224]|uniref:hypothetical protein n=1 Tax=Rheinheimera sp. MM224 TaxID=3019969 RepID=UPI0021F88762|nr:hypothetical protein [Rheinheimera sp. MM224]CAI3798817.1 hypothetical protein JAMGFMIE_02164 [Rheinheimera sp. MM224]